MTFRSNLGSLIKLKIWRPLHAAPIYGHETLFSVTDNTGYLFTDVCRTSVGHRDKAGDKVRSPTFPAVNHITHPLAHAFVDI